MQHFTYNKWKHFWQCFFMFVQWISSNYFSCTCERVLKAITFYRRQARKVRVKISNDSKVTCLLSLKYTKRNMSRVTADLRERGINCNVSNVRSLRQRYRGTGRWSSWQFVKQHVTLCLSAPPPDMFENMQVPWRKSGVTAPSKNWQIWCSPWGWDAL